MQRFVSSYDPSISLRVTIRSDQMARVYPVGWRSARIAVFRPLPALWHRDREAAQAILLHEVAHRRQGDQLIVGLGSPFVMLMRIWAPAYLLLVLIPATVYLAVGRSILAPFVGVPTVALAAMIPGVIFLPVTALWLAELGADRMPAQAIGSGAVRQALLATAGSRASLVARVLALLSHPPRRLRLRFAAARPAGTAGLVAVWPAALLVWLLVLPVALAVLDLLLAGFPVSLMETGLREATYTVLADGRPVVIATAILCSRGQSWLIPGSGCGLPRRAPAATSPGGPTSPPPACPSACCWCLWLRSRSACPRPCPRRNSRLGSVRSSPAGNSAEAK